MSERDIQLVVKRNEIRLVSPDLDTSARAYREFRRSCIVSAIHYGRLSEWIFLQRMQWQFVKDKGKILGIPLEYRAYIHAMRLRHKRDMPTTKTVSIRRKRNTLWWADIQSVLSHRTTLKSDELRWTSNAILEKRMSPEEYQQYLISDR